MSEDYHCPAFRLWKLKECHAGQRIDRNIIIIIE